MKKVFSVILVFLVLIASCASAEGRISANGSATVYTAADWASISLGVDFDGSDVAELQNKSNETILAICEALKAEGLAEEEISTGSFNISALYDYRDDHRVLTGYNVSNTLSVNTANIDRLGSYIDAAFSAGANSFNSVHFSLRDSDSAKKEALKLAVENAVQKAKIMAEAYGCELGALVQLSEGGANASSYYETEEAVNDMAFKTAAAAAGTTIRASQIAVSANVEIVFEVK